MKKIKIATPKVYTMEFFFPHKGTTVFAGYVAACSLQEAVDACYNNGTFDKRQQELHKSRGYFPEGVQWEFKATNYHDPSETTHPIQN